MGNTPEPWAAPKPLPERIETPRLVLRAWRDTDAAGMLAAIDVDRASFLPWLPWVKADNRTLTECSFNIERFRRSSEAAGATDFVLGIFDRATGEPLGGTGLHDIRIGVHEAEIGYWMRKDRCGQGLCTEAVRHLISWAFASQSSGGWGLRRIVIKCAGKNAASARVCRKIGLREESRLVRDRWIDGIGWDDTLSWGVDVSEWDAAAHQPRAGQQG